MGYIIDVQCFNGSDNELVVKELAVTSLDGSIFQHFIFKPPYSKHCLSVKQISQNNWLQKFYHGFHWDDGFIEYENLKFILSSIINPDEKNVFVKGLEKKHLIEKILERSDVCDLTSLGCPSLKYLRSLKHITPKCHIPNLHNRMNCATENILHLSDWYNHTCKDECGVHRKNTPSVLQKCLSLWRICGK